MKKYLTLLFVFFLAILLVGCSDRKISKQGVLVVFYTGKNATSIKTVDSYVIGDKILKPEDPTNLGYEFDGWYTTNNFLEGTEWKFDIDTLESSITLYAKWISGIYDLVFNLDEGVVSGELPKQYTSGQTILFPIATKRGYTFNGWFLVPPTEVKPGQQGLSSTSGQSGNLELYAKFTPISVQLTFRIGIQGEPQPSSVELPRTTTISYGSIINLPVLDNTEGYRFLGWYTSNGVEFKNGDIFTRLSRTILYAKWEVI